MQSPPTPPAWPQRWQVANGGGFFEQKEFGDTSSTAPTLLSTVASKQLSAGQEEMGLNFVLAASFSHFARGQVHRETFPICFLFEYNMPHILEKTRAGDCASCSGGKAGLYLLTWQVYVPSL